MSHPPIILVSSDRHEGIGHAEGPLIRPKQSVCAVKEDYISALVEVGVTPLIVPAGLTRVDHLLLYAHGILLTGGNVDIHPSIYGEDATGRLDRIEPKRTDTEMALARAALDMGMPILGICGGMQVLAVADGGSLIQDLPTPSEKSPHLIAHEQPTDPSTPWHRVDVSPPASCWLGESLTVNSTHHQGVRNTGDRLICCGWSDDGVVEVIASKDPTVFALGVQWHPERLGDYAPYDALNKAALQYQRGRS